MSSKMSGGSGGSGSAGGPAEVYIDDLLACPVCMERFDEAQRRAKMLDCQHVVCTTCLATLLTACTVTVAQPAQPDQATQPPLLHCPSCLHSQSIHLSRGVDALPDCVIIQQIRKIVASKIAATNAADKKATAKGKAGKQQQPMAATKEKAKNAGNGIADKTCNSKQACDGQHQTGSSDGSVGGSEEDMCRVIAGFGICGTQPACLQYPTGVATTPAGDILVCDTNNNRLQLFNADTIYVRQYGREGSGKCEFRRPYDVAVNSQQQIIVCDRHNQRTQLLERGGKFLCEILHSDQVPTGGGGGKSKGKKHAGGGGGGARRASAVREPISCATSYMDHIYILDGVDRCVHIHEPDGRYLERFGYSRLRDPGYLCIQGMYIYITDWHNHAVHVYNIVGTYVKTIGEGILRNPRGITVDANNGNVIVGESWEANRITFLSPDGKLISRYGCEGTDLGQFQGVVGLAMMPSNEEFVVCDYLNHRLQLIKNKP